MSPSALPDQDRLWDLLADRATHGLDGTDSAELDRLFGRVPGIDADAMDRAAAAVDVAVFGAGASETLPADLRIRVLAAAKSERVAMKSGSMPTSAPIRFPRPSSSRATLPWLVAAACAIVAAAGWFGRSGVAPTDRTVAVGVAEVERFRREASDATTVAWERGPDPAAAECEGEVVWSGSRQDGYMVFRGLRANDPTREQYQLWIFDQDRDERYPVHGGVFDVAPDASEAVVRIRPHLSVPSATMFVVTVERPGGVWVSDRSRIPVLAKVRG